MPVSILQKLLKSVIIVLGLPLSIYAQADSVKVRKTLQKHINALAAPAMHGRGYVQEGMKLAADYIDGQFHDMGLVRGPGMTSYRQHYSYSVNTFPGQVAVKLNDQMLTPGKDFLADASSGTYKGKKLPVATYDVSTVASGRKWKKKIVKKFDKHHVWLLQGTDSLLKRTGMSRAALPFILPKGCFMVPVHGKQIWTVSREHADGTAVLYIQDTIMPAKLTHAEVQVEAKIESNFDAVNVVAKVPGEIPDSFLVVSAHYDHLGQMGSAIFPGASDNASGVAMLLYLAEYFAQHKPRYTMVFIAFSGEEAGLLGSKSFTAQPPFALQKIKFLTNLDIMGDATNGVTVVNATLHPQQFDRLKVINERGEYLSEIKSRGKAANSDHHPFSEKGVPAFFIYSNGGKGFYHDIYDRAEEIKLSRIAGAAQLFIDFLEGF
jgi:hypothetical protein